MRTSAAGGSGTGAASEGCSEQGVRLAQKMQVGPCIPVGVQLKKLKLAQLLGQLHGVFLTCSSTPMICRSKGVVSLPASCMRTPALRVRT
jgi:hypothetical protein